MRRSGMMSSRSSGIGAVPQMSPRLKLHQIAHKALLEAWLPPARRVSSITEGEILRRAVDVRYWHEADLGKVDAHVRQ